MPIICNAKIAGVQFFEMIHKQPLVGYIHSVFDRVVNIEVLNDSLPDTLFSFGREDVSIAPAMLITDIGQDVSLAAIGLIQGDWVKVHTGYLTTSTLTISTAAVKVWKPACAAEIRKIDFCSFNELMTRIKEIAMALNKNNQGAHLPSAVFNQSARKSSFRNEPASQELVGRTKNLLLHALDGTHPGEAIDSLLGFGLGLTPSGDDVIAGFLHGICYVERYSGNIALWKDSMITDLEQQLSRTNRISRHFLRYAMKGLWSEAIQSFLMDATDRKTTNFLQSARRLTSFGASSGYDILTGICIGLLAGYRSLIKE